MTLRQWLNDQCRCGGEKRREVRGSLSLYVCTRCGKPAAEKKAGAYANEGARRDLPRKGA